MTQAEINAKIEKVKKNYKILLKMSHQKQYDYGTVTQLKAYQDFLKLHHVEI